MATDETIPQDNEGAEDWTGDRVGDRIRIVTRESTAWVTSDYPGWRIIDSDDVEGGTSYLLERYAK